MLKTTTYSAKTTEPSANTHTLNDVLKSMHISASLLINEAYTPPWGVAIPESTQLVNLLKQESKTQTIAFHYVKRGYIKIIPKVGNPVKVNAGELAICFGGIAHQLTQGQNDQTVGVETILLDGNNPFTPNEANLANSTSVICGVFKMENTKLNPLFAALPPLLHVTNTQRDNANGLNHALNWIDQDITNSSQPSYIIEKLLELLCIEVLRTHLDNKVTGKGWIKAMQDPIISRAISQFHARPNGDWSVKKLADYVALSPSRFAARFNAALGDSPMIYITKWRMNIASRLLKENQQKVEEVANAVGYENVAAFSRTFKKYCGTSPAVWRGQSKQTPNR